MDPHIKKVIKFIVSPVQKYKTFAYPILFAVSEIESDSYSSKNYYSRKHYVFRYTFSGQGKVTVNGKSSIIYPGTAILFEFPSDKYEFTKDPDCSDIWKGMYLEFDAGALKPLIDELIDTYGTIFTPTKEMDISKKMFEFDRAWIPGKTWFNGNFINMSPVEANSLILFLLSALKPFENQTVSMNTKVVNSVCSYIDSHLKKTLKIEDLSRKFHVSRGHLTRLFKQHLNVSPNHYIRITRVRQICSLIFEGNLTHSEIMEKVGIKSSVQYHRLFKQMTGITPGEFKKSDNKLEILKCLH
jgi:AraC-like DNA-binding protein